MASFNRSNRFNFWFIAVLVVVTAAFIIAVSLPQIQAAQYHSVDKLLAQAKNNPNQAQALTEQAATVGWNDPVAIETLAEQYQNRGEFNKALQVYTNSAVSVNPIYTGYLALQYNQPSTAQTLFHKAEKDGEDAQAQAGLALASFVLGNNTDGCTHADRAVKLDLSEKRATAAQQVCQIMQQQSQLSDREQAYVLLDNYLYKIGEEKLQNINNKTALDLLFLAKVQANRGELTNAIDSVKQGLVLDQSNKDLLQAIITYLQKSGRGSEANDYQTRLNDVMFVKQQ